jgi:hypothetical protein
MERSSCVAVSAVFLNERSVLDGEAGGDGADAAAATAPGPWRDEGGGVSTLRTKAAVPWGAARPTTAAKSCASDL